MIRLGTLRILQVLLSRFFTSSMRVLLALRISFGITLSVWWTLVLNQSKTNSLDFQIVFQLFYPFFCFFLRKTVLFFGTFLYDWFYVAAFAASDACSALFKRFNTSEVITPDPRAKPATKYLLSERFLEISIVLRSWIAVIFIILFKDYVSCYLMWLGL